MIEILDFCGKHPWWSFFIVLIGFQALVAILRPSKKVCPHCGKPYNAEMMKIDQRKDVV